MAAKASKENRPSIPPDLWVDIVRQLPRDTARTCLSVSRHFHDLALRVVFARVSLSFEAFELQYYPDVVVLRNRDLIYGRQEVQRRRARELLERMANDASLASAIQTLQIHASMSIHLARRHRQRDTGTGEQITDAAWSDLVLAAIPLLRNLRNFSWYNGYPSPDDTMIKRLVDSCPLLERFEAPLSFMDRVSTHLLDGIKMIHPNWTEEETRDAHGNPTLVLAPALQAFYKKLLSPMSSTRSASPCLLATIKDLELFFHRHIPEDLEDILHSARRMESLTMVPYDMWDYDQQERMYRSLSTIPLDLTCFQSLTIGPGGGSLHGMQPNLLCKFLESRPRLRRLALRSTLTFVNAELFLDSLKTLKELNAIALTLDCDYLPPMQWLDLLTTHLPPSLTALALELQDGYASKDTFTELWSRLRNLQFIYMNVRFGLTSLTPNQFLQGASNSLRVACYQDRFYDVLWTTDGPRVVMPPWPSRKVHFRTAEDFGSADVEWLMRHYTFFDYIPGSW